MYTNTKDMKNEVTDLSDLVEECEALIEKKNNDSSLKKKTKKVGFEQSPPKKSSKVYRKPLYSYLKEMYAKNRSRKKIRNGTNEDIHI